jgi:gamma-D-glutamyl-L-lysine dipeptidyl-peptidase
MIEAIQSLLSEIRSHYPDSRMHVCELSIAALENNHLALQGKVLDDTTLQSIYHAFGARLPQLQVDTSAVRVLRQAAPRLLYVATNITSLHIQPSWLAEMLNQNAFGTALELLEEKERWVFIRQMDGYLGWMYLPYLSEVPSPAPIYIVAMPLAQIHLEPNIDSPINSRLVGGTLVQVVSTRGAWAEVDANAWGWVPLADLRSLDLMPKSLPGRRKAITNDAARMVGVPYLWGGTSVQGIDCSGLAQLLHRWIGLTIPRDADMQYEAGRKIEPPYQTGDLLFFGEKNEKRTITHVAISLGDWQIIHSSRSRNGVYYDQVQQVPHLRDSFLGAATFL